MARFDFRNPAADMNYVLGLHRLGLSIVPAHLSLIDQDGYICTCSRARGCKGKHPLLAQWRQLQHVTLTEQQVRHYFQNNGWANCGQLHGWKDGTALSTLALDFDGEEGRETLRELEGTLGPLPIETPTILTGGGGIQHFFQHPGKAFAVPTVKHAAPNVDIRGDGGFSMLPPSIHPSTHCYTWECDLDLEDVPLATLPDQWMQWVLAATSHVTVRQKRSSTGSPMTAPAVKVKDASGQTIIDGREQFMTETVYKTFMRQYRETKGFPTLESLTAAAWEAYSAQVDLSRAGRGFDELVVKCQAILKARHLNLPLLEAPSLEDLLRRD